MLSKDRAALICDLAEVYRIYDYKSMPPFFIATLACGLGINSRIKTKLSGRRFPLSLYLEAAQTDALNIIAWSKTKDAQHGRNRPKSIVEAMNKSHEQRVKEGYGFDSIDSFEKWHESMTR